MNAQLGLAFGEVSKMEFEFKFLLQPGLKFTFVLDFELDYGLKTEFAFEVTLEMEFEFATSSIRLPAFL